ncbi:MAG: hypothetical protein LJE89_04650 [Deltaproteobacteria bacterium]|nr:hypothetical protein [Deltaproteobacteria bacterium]
MDLTKPPNKIVVYCVAGLALFLWLGVWLFGPKRENVLPGAPLDKMLVTLAQSDKGEKKEVEEKPEELVPGDWGRDPFYFPYQAAEEVAPPTEKVVRPKPVSVERGPQYRLSTILISGANRLAVINDRVYALGDEIGNEKISDITLDHVVLSGAYGERLLNVPQPQTQIKVESTGSK